MLTDFMFTTLRTVVSVVFGWFPRVDIPSFLLNGGTWDQAIDDLVAGAAGFGAWIPFGIMAELAVVFLGCIAFGWGVHISRMILSLFTGGGGKA